ncbi:aminodeoxychorismate/anthranilate synthase component II [Alphaproteobacteria bacterium]|nr:aminodeoxychorismate/anthranilate synthase component II [Alphaproteobacteria bacterium]
MYILIDNYDSFTHIIRHYLDKNNTSVEVYRNNAICAKDIIKKKPKGIIISPGPKTPNEAGISLELIRLSSKNIPVLGICLGHQSIAQAYGGKIIRAKNIMHGKLSMINHDNSLIFNNIPQNFQATRYHSLIVEKSSLPKNLVINATSKDGYIMAITDVNAKAYGLQFHPESHDTEYGYKLINNFIKICEKNESY